MGRKVAGVPMACRGTLMACQVRAQTVPVACHVCAKAQGWHATSVPLRAMTVPGLCLVCACGPPNHTPPRACPVARTLPATSGARGWRGQWARHSFSYSSHQSFTISLPIQTHGFLVASEHVKVYLTYQILSSFVSINIPFCSKW